MTGAVLFDLDNTLAPTSKLEKVRLGTMKWDNLPHETLESVRPYPKVPALIDALSKLGVRMGVVTNSPRRYCIPLLEHLGLKHYFQSIVAFDDVKGAVKPNPDGIKLALENLGIAADARTLYFGDELNDVAAAYRAGVTPVLGSWGSRLPVNSTPALVLSTSDVIDYCQNPSKFSLIGELYANNAAKKTPLPPTSDLFFLGLNLDGHCVTLRNDVAVFALGRYFSQKSVTTALHHDAHNLSKHIEKKSLAGPFSIPAYWVELFANLIEILPKNKVLIDVVTIIPSKPEDKDNRLERLLHAVETKYRQSNPGATVQFRNDVLRFRPGAKGMKTLDYQTRQQEIDKSLVFGNAADLAGKSVLVIDDVTTSLATIRKAHSLLMSAGASNALGMVLAKTVSILEDHKECPACGRLMRVRRNRSDNSRFWGCSGYFEIDEAGNRACRHTLSIN